MEFTRNKQKKKSKHELGQKERIAQVSHLMNFPLHNLGNTDGCGYSPLFLHACPTRGAHSPAHRKDGQSPVGTQSPGEAPLFWSSDVSHHLDPCSGQFFSLKLHQKEKAKLFHFISIEKYPKHKKRKKLLFSM